MSDKPNKGLEVTYEQIAGFLEISKRKELQSKELLKYILKNDTPCSEGILNTICELFSVSNSVTKYLTGFLEMENVTERTVFKISPSSVMTMSTLIVNLVQISESLRGIYSLEIH